MTYGDGYDNGSSFEDGKNDYNTAIKHVGEKRKDEARRDLVSAIDIFKMCSQQQPEAARYLERAQQELQKLG